VQPERVIDLRISPIVRGGTAQKSQGGTLGWKTGLAQSKVRCLGGGNCGWEGDVLGWRATVQDKRHTGGLTVVLWWSRFCVLGSSFTTLRQSQVADGLQFLHHEANLVHRGVSPGVVLLTAVGAWKLAGLGLAVQGQFGNAEGAQIKPFDFTNSSPPLWLQLTQVCPVSGYVWCRVAWPFSPVLTT